MKFPTSALFVALLSVPGLSQRTEDAQLAPPNAPGLAYMNTGQVVAADGEWVAISSYAHGGVGSRAGVVFLYRQTTTGYVLFQTIRELESSLGPARCLALDGDTLVFGTPAWGIPRLSLGRLYTYQWDGTFWRKGQVIEADGLASSYSPLFGFSVALSGDVLVVSARGADEPYENAGELRIYERNQGDWLLEKRFRGRRRRQQSTSFAASIAVDGGIIAASSASDEDRVFIYEKVVGEWRFTQFIEAPVNPGAFGLSLDLSEETLVVGDPAHIGGNPRRGKAYVYSRDSNGSWGLDQTLGASDGYANADYGDEFGWSVSIDQGLVVVGARNGLNSGVPRGSAYVFRKTAAGWLSTENVRLISSDPPAGWGNFGNSVWLSDSVIIIGDHSATIEHLRTGKAYAYRR